MKANKLILGLVLLVGVLVFASAAYTHSTFQATSSGTRSAFEKDMADISFDSSMCQEGQDFIVQIAPFGCEPAVVRSDLLEEQDVPVFCKLQAVKINPFIDITAINSIDINIRGAYPEGVKSVGFTPSYDALGKNRKLNNLQWDEIGYATIVLRQNPNESSMSDFVTGNLSATFRYDLENAFGLRKHTFYLPLMEDNEFDRSLGQYAFFNKMGYLRAEDVTKDSASIAIYSGRYESPFGKSREGEINRQRIGMYNLQVGQQTNKIYLPGFDCFSAVQFRLENIEFQDTRVRFNINSQIFEVKEDENFLEGKCRVTDIEKTGLNQIVKVSCQEDEGRDTFDLRISPKIKLEINGVEGEYAVGDYLFETDESKHAYLGFVGSQSYEAKDLVAYVVIADAKMAKLGESEILAAGKLGEANPNEKNLLEEAKKITRISIKFYKWLMDGKHFQRLNYSESKIIGGTKVEIIGFGSESDYPVTSKIEEYYGKALDDYDYIFSNYQGEIYPEDQKISLGEKSAYAKMLLARDTSQKKDLKFFCDEFESSYPDSELERDFCENLILLSNQGVSTKDLMIEGDIKRISFEGVYQPSIEDYGIVLYVREKGGNVESHELRKEQILYLDESGQNYVQLVSITDENTVVLNFNIEGKTTLARAQDILISGNRGLKKEISKTFGNYTFTIHDIYFERVAKVSVEPSINYAGSEIDFNFAVGIEKRLIQLSPEMTENAIDKLDDTIETWESISSTLGDTVDVLEKTCLAVGGFLTLKNLLFNSGGESIARQEVMSGNGGWYERCADMVAVGDYRSEGECLQDKAGNIDDEVNLLAEMLKSQNEEIKNIQEDEEVSQSQGLFGTNVVNTTKLVEKYLPKVKASLRKRGEFIEDPTGKEKGISVSSLEIILTPEYWNKNLFSFDLLKKIELYANILNKGGMDVSQTKSYKSKLFIVVKQLDINSKNSLDVNNWASSVGITSDYIDFIKIGDNVQELPYDDLVFEDLKFSEVKEYDVNKLSSHVYVLNQLSQLSGRYSDMDVKGFIDDLYNNSFLSDAQYDDFKGEIGTSHEVSELNVMLPIVKNTPVKLLQGSDGRKYILILEKSKTDKLNILVDGNYKPFIYNRDGNRLSIKNISKDVRNIFCKKYDSSSYKNSYKNPEIKYYETDPYKGLPSVVPFDTKDGWYAYVEQNIDFMGEVRSYDKSARVNSFWLCNVGNNGLEEFSKGNTGDDICQLINLGTGQPYNQFSGLKTNEAARLINQAVNAIEQASRAYKDGVKVVEINNQRIEVGSPAISSALTKCEDYMSPKDCNLLFNVCDPVICPSSRCDFGGQYPVQDVIQSGIIGSLLLCLPNYHEDIYMPVCLTGVKSGLDSYLSVMKSYQSCLQESLDTGSTVGICDQINSIYICEFFWRQALPLAELTLPKIVGAITGENTRGGGEYSSLTTAWDNAKNSVNFFTEFYAINSFNAFKARSQEEIGSEVCRSFISFNYPEGQGILDSLTIANSPPQYSGNFEAIPFTTTIVPPVSQYKVFYHIYAGEDQGAYYKVYLRGGSGSSYYQDTSSGRMVASGYIPVGEYATGTEDFIAPEGYKELCIAVNNEEECGFKEVSTSFAFDYVRDQSRQSQIENTNIKSQDECISGSANIYGLLNLNVQEGIANTVDPEIYNQGIVRICATDNPGSSDPYLGSEDQRWIDVGYCGDSNIRCWIDQESIDRALEFQTSVNESLEELSEKFKENLENDKGYLNPEQFAEKIDNITKEKNRDKRFDMIKELFDKVYLNNHKAYLYYLRAGIYEEIVHELFAKLDTGEKKGIREGRPTYENEYKTVLDIVTAEGFESGEFEFHDARAALRMTSNQPNVCYKFINNGWDYGWYWTLECNKIGSYSSYAEKNIDWISVNEPLVNPYSRNTLTKTSKEFIPKLKKKNYLEGIDLLMKRAKLNKEGGIVNSLGLAKTFITIGDLIFDHRGRFSEGSESQPRLQLYFQYRGEKWNYYLGPYGASEDSDWMDLDVFPEDMELSQNETLFLKIMGDLNFLEGAAVLFGDVSLNELGSFVKQTRIGKWTYASALEEIEKFGSGTYEDMGVKEMVDGFYEDGLLSKEDYINFIDEEQDIGIFGKQGGYIWTGTEFEARETCPMPEEPSEEVLKLGNARERVLKIVDELVGKKAYIGVKGCFSAVEYVYEKAGVTHSCVYSDNEGRSYSIGDGIRIGIDKKLVKGKWVIIYQMATYPTRDCSLNKKEGENLPMSDKLAEIQPGDILSYAYDDDDGHNVIFIKWIDSDILKAEVFDWNGPRVNGKKTYRITNVLLQDDEHPVYMYWKPIILGQATEETEADEVKISSLEIEEEEEIVIQDTTAPEIVVPVEINYVEYTLDSAIEKAGTLKGDYSSSQENQDFMDALLAQGIINRVEFYKYSNKWKRYSKTPQMSDLRTLLLLIKKNAGLENSIEKIPTYEFTGDERAVFNEGEVCSNCGDDEDWYTLGFGNLCDEEECFVLGIALGENCWYENKECLKK